MAHPRQRLRPWLMDQINSGQYPGLQWIDKERMIFRIPWKHFGRPGVNEQRDAMLFKAWALHTGKHREGEPADLSTWKTRFRCALYKLPDIEECSDENRLDGDDPFRVYRLKTREEVVQQQQLHQQQQQQQQQQISIDPYSQQSIASPPSREDRVAQGLVEMKNEVIRDAFIKIENGDLDGSGFTNIDDLREGLGDMGIPDPEGFLKGVIEDLIPDTNHLNATNPMAISPISPGSISNDDNSRCSPFPSSPMSQNLGSPQPPALGVSPLTVKLHLLGNEVGHCTVSNAMGLRVAFRPPPPLPEGVASDDSVEVVSHIFGPFDAEQVYFPPSDNPQAAQLLEYMNRGLVFQAREGNIYATRLCRAKVFYSSSFQGNPAPKELVREQTTKVFDLKNEFLPMLSKHAIGQGPLPSYELFFSFGQLWGADQTLKDNMVYVSVLHCLAEEQLKAFTNRANHSSQVLISGPNVLDEIASQIADLNVSSNNRNPSPMLL